MRILDDSILIFHEAFLDIIGNEPARTYKDPTHNPFHQKSISVLSETTILMDTLRK